MKSIKNKRKKILFPAYILLCNFIPFTMLYPGEKDIKILLKIFHKRRNIIIKNSKGLYLNHDYSKKYKQLQIRKRDHHLLCNDKIYDSISIQPAKRDATAFITRFGRKTYQGDFTISLKSNHFYIINTTSLNAYLEGVVGAELGDSFNIETLKAQAVAARSYFFKARKKYSNFNIDACDTGGNFQVYKGAEWIGPKTRKAVYLTKDEILLSSNNDFVPYYHSTCGGMLLLPEEAWGDVRIDSASIIRRYDGSRESSNCAISPYYKWDAELEKTKIIDALSSQLEKEVNDVKFVINGKGILQNVILLSHNNRIAIKGFKFKSLLEKEGISSIRSVRLSVKEDGRDLYFKGKGFGHLVGMCQWGAEFMARKGMGYREILRFYFQLSI